MGIKRAAVKIDAVNVAIVRLAGESPSKAKAVLQRFGVSNTPALRPDQYRAVIDLAEMELAKFGVPLAPNASPAHEFDIEGHPVQVHESHGHRLWHCDCAYFQRTLAIYNEGFCPHVVVAIGLALRDGTMDLGFAVKRTNKEGAS